MSNLTYHLSEFEIARRADDARHVMPVLPARFEKVLDLGCGIGQTISNLPIPPDAMCVGIDVDKEALAYGKSLSGNIRFLCARGECLPFADGSFDVLLSRVALPYTHLPSALREISRVLKPSGHVWFILHPFSIVQEQCGEAIKMGNLKSVFYQVYILMNSLLFHLTGRQFRYPLNRRRCESFQTAGGITRAMQTAGFDQIKVDSGKFFVVTAIKSIG